MRTLRFRPGRATGFTLVEVLVALTILSLVMLATVTALRTLAGTQVAVERITARVDEIRSVSTFLRDTLNSVASDKGGSGGLSLGGASAERAIFELSANALTWKAVVLFGEGFGGSYVVRVAREGKALVLRWIEPQDYSLTTDWNKAPSRTLVSGLSEFTVDYRREPQDAWRSEWDKGGPPGWVRVRIRAQERYWPDLVMQVVR